ncbi:uracil-xanthine permease family protein [Mycetocola reblochoni]|uniref:Uracil permease n=2 Tax=Mycetocola reblochoni TaxID=331618 RepID=A0A1R4K9H8_9MICO|nr:solute carrier family 23 protein [Mycetocola reblochoni]RLP68089.1 nitrate reductase [Mycetocola reblochoni]SJN40673.1 Uracil permease [Mycetocola reblochoni REB411]
MTSPWTLHGNGRDVASSDIVAPDERLSWPRTIGLGMQHVVAMFGATFLVPALTGLSPTATLFFSGLGTILFQLITRNRMPSYLGSSFAFLAPIAAATASGELGGAQFGILAVGVLLALIGVVTQLVGTRWIDVLMPPVVAGAIVALIGFNLAPTAIEKYTDAPVTATVTLAAIVVSAVLFRGILGRLSILLGVLIGYGVAVLRGEVDFTRIAEAPLLGLPAFTAPGNPVADPALWGLLPAFIPVVLVLVAENVGHIRSVAQMTGRPETNRLTGRALLADGVATVLAGAGGGAGTTTYGENIGVMAATRIYSTAAYWVAGGFALLLSFSPLVGAVINSIPAGVLGGTTTALYGLIGIIGVKIWLDNDVDFRRPVMQMTASVALIVGIANPSLVIGTLEFNGIALGTIAAVVVYHVMSLIGRWRGTD